RGMEQAHALHAAIGRATEDGLDPASYGHGTAARLIALLEATGDDTLDAEARVGYAADLDVVLSEGFMRYARDIAVGAIDPDSVGDTWRIPRSEPPGEQVLRSVVRGGDPTEVIHQLRPGTPYYGRLMSALARLHQVRDAGGWQALPNDFAVAGGDSSDAVALLRARLSASDDPREARLAQRGAANPAVYDPDLLEALRHFQERHAIVSDGKVGSGTLRELNHSLDERLAEVRLNMERWRWLPQDLGRFFVLVNIAGFELEVVENDRAIESMNVVVGMTGWHTPVFADTIEYVVVNPYWTPPQSILEEEVLPAIARDPTYLERNNFERTANGVIRQRPGSSNALGQYKFIFPNDDNIYLHDTPADHLFSRVRRDFSHGCIRIERPADLARLLVSKASRHSAASLDGFLATGAEKWIPLSKPVPVYLVYFTAWAQEDGTLRFHHDVYGHDDEVGSQSEQLETVQRDIAEIESATTAESVGA
ncbi:MAG: L,D-transpeptidase family protein, partial [Gemmatimonadetes bacterium]|nr:L,D-transpeptidase family protein [Gemmatimonadota bacterium]